MMSAATTICATLSVAYSARGIIYINFKEASPDESAIEIEITTSSPHIPSGCHINHRPMPKWLGPLQRVLRRRPIKLRHGGQLQYPV
jgi:hypothetical protein